MATLIPAIGACISRMTSGEKRFAWRLEDKLEDDYLCWYDVSIGERTRHPDFVVFHPTPGLKSELKPLEQTRQSGIVTSSEELEGFHTVRAIVRSLVPTKRVVMRDAQSYCAALLDDNDRKPICRLRFNNKQKLRLGIFNSQQEEEQVLLESVDDVYNYEEQLQAIVASYVRTLGT